MKSFRILLVAVMLAVPLWGQAKNEPTFAGGFSSGKSGTKSQPAKAKPADRSPAPAKTANAQSSFGSFGSGKGAKATPAPAPATAPAVPAHEQTQKSTSALSRNLNQNSAQANALKALDARNASKSAPGNSMIGSNLSGPATAATNATGQPPYAPPIYSAPAPAPAPPVVYQNNSSGSLTSGIIGFLLGKSMSHNERSYNSNNQGGYGENRTGDSPNKSGVVSANSEVAGGSSFLRILVWLLILAGIGAVIWYFVQRSSAKAQTAAKRNYSL
jgi:hypothetical protein